jgi:hypothetical protein
MVMMYKNHTYMHRIHPNTHTYSLYPATLELTVCKLPFYHIDIDHCLDLVALLTINNIVNTSVECTNSNENMRCSLRYRQYSKCNTPYAM